MSWCYRQNINQKHNPKLLAQWVVNFNVTDKDSGGHGMRRSKLKTDYRCNLFTIINIC